MVLLFQKTSTRTRCAGEIGTAQLGGHALYLNWQDTNFDLADLGDEFRVLSGYSDFIVARLLEHADVRRAAVAAQVPLINGCCNRYHPLQALADLMTLQEAFGRLEGDTTDIRRGAQQRRQLAHCRRCQSGHARHLRLPGD